LWGENSPGNSIQDEIKGFAETCLNFSWNFREGETIEKHYFKSSVKKQYHRRGNVV
jgi:hypothetical protein